MPSKLAFAALAVALPLTVSCHLDQQLGAPELSGGNELMRRYVSVGNSITAGFQSAGINDSTQRETYAVQVARRAGASFVIPELAFPGCPPPLVNNLTGEQVGPPLPTGCALRRDDPLPPVINNVAVPGAHAIDPLDNLDPTSNANALTTLILGGQTQLQALARANPTLVTVWIGNNDVLGALIDDANPGNPAEITSQAAFEASYGSILNQIDASGAPAVLFSVLDVTLIPFASRGATYWCLSAGAAGACGVPPQLPPALTVDLSCAPSTAVPTSEGERTLIPWTKGIPRVLAAAQGAPSTIDCTIDSEVVTPAELDAIQQAVVGYNGYIEAQAAASGGRYAYLDLGPAMLARVADGTIPPFPVIPPDAPNSPVTFGPYISLDGVHPTRAANTEVADSLVSILNRAFGTNIP